MLELNRPTVGSLLLNHIIIHIHTPILTSIITLIHSPITSLTPIAITVIGGNQWLVCLKRPYLKFSQN